MRAAKYCHQHFQPMAAFLKDMQYDDVRTHRWWRWKMAEIGENEWITNAISAQQTAKGMMGDLTATER